MSKDRNDPGRFFGDGVTFKAKLIGILEVGEARGDRMCQEALQDLKMAIRAAGEHKQRITIHVTIDGLRLRDEKTGDSLYHHPVHKISFIAQDMTDSRAFGYIFGSPDSGHRFFGIKTDKAASQVVLAMRDLFQVVFELKKKEIEMARQQIQSKIIHEHQPITLNVKSTGTDPLSSGMGYGKITDAGKSNTKEMSPESVADLVDLEQELSSIQRGITQMERITPSEPTAGPCKGLSEEDPFGDSFTAFPTYQLLPPPESSRRKINKLAETSSESPGPASNTQTLSTLVGLSKTTTNSNTTNDWLEKQVEITQISFDAPKPSAVEPLSSISVSSSSTAPHLGNSIGTKTTTIPSIDESSATVSVSSNGNEDLSKPAIASTTNLDPLGTGKSKPYVDKKYFFHELKNPPKKVLKDLSGQKDTFTATFRENDTDRDDVFDLNDDRFDLAMDSRSDEHHTTKTMSAKAKELTGSDKTFTIDFEHTKLDEPIMMKRDTDPFSPTRKKSDPFQEGGDIFNKLDPFEFEFANKQTILPDTKIVSDESIKPKRETTQVFNGPLQVSLPPEDWNSTQRRIERQTNESPTAIPRNRPSVFKQNTVDVISSISSKKMPHLFGSTKFTKRDSNSINMRRLQESDSLSENETAPEPPPRPDSVSHIEPPPLPPKKQFTDIVIRPRITSSSAIPPPTRYDYVTAKMRQHQSLDNAPPIPLPSRKVGRTDSSYPGPGRPGYKPGDEDDYLTPLGGLPSDVPPLLPPPQTKGRGRRYEYLDKTESSEATRNDAHNEPALPDITLSQLLTLGIDELAAKLNVPSTKLSTMTLVELTSYLSNFIENSKRTQEKQQQPLTKSAPVEEVSIFKVNFDQNPDATFVAKFDDNFGEESGIGFVANFADFDTKQTDSTATARTSTSQIPSVDRYAAFREIIEQEKQNDESDPIDSSGQEDDASSTLHQSSTETLPVVDTITTTTSNIVVPITKIDTKITEAISHAKDRYAALRDIILVEDLFEKPARVGEPDLMGDDEKEQDLFEEMERGRSPNEAGVDSTEMNSSDTGTGFEIDKEKTKQADQFVHTLTVSNNDDLEIDEYMNRAISNLSLDSRGDRLTPGMNKSPNLTDAGTSPKPPGQELSKSPMTPLTHEMNTQFNDMSTSPIPLQKSPANRSPLSKSPLAKSPYPPQSPAVANLIEPKKRPDSGSMSDIVCGSSPEADRLAANTEGQSKTEKTTPSATESWAIFEKAVDKKSPREPSGKSSKTSSKAGKEFPESPCSSDTKDEWKGEQEYVKKWPKGQTSSSSRDLSPWDDETSDYKKRPPPDRTDRHGYYMRHARRMNSCDDDYDYEEEVSKRRDRRTKGGSHIGRSRENFDSDSQNWYHSNSHHHWSPPEDDDGRSRGFDRSLYERGTYGPPHRDHKVSAHLSYDRRGDYKNYDKRKYYREYSRPDYNFESYGESPDVKDRKMMYYGEKARRDYENIYEEGFGRGSKSREFYYDRDRKSFDRDSVESYESAQRRQRSFGSGDVYGSLDSREEFRERYMGGGVGGGSGEKTRSLRKPIKMRSNEEYEPDSENGGDGGGGGEQMRRGVVSDTRSLQRPNQSGRMRKSSGSSPWDGEDPVPGPVSSQKSSWKRPASASESERRLAENRRVLAHTLSGSDGEKDKRFRRRSRSRKEDGSKQPQQQFGTYRHPTHRDEVYDYIDYDDYGGGGSGGIPMDEDKFERLNRRRQDMHQRMMDAERRKKTAANDKFTFDDDEDITMTKYVSKNQTHYTEKDRHQHKFDVFDEPKSGKSLHRSYDFDDFEETPRSNASSSSKFHFEDHGFESDFNSPTPSQPQALLPPTAVSSGTSSTTNNITKSSFRFSNDFSDKEHKQGVNFESIEINQTQIQKLRFDDKVTVSKFENEKTITTTSSAATTTAGAFEDDFSKAEFILENEDRWTAELPKRTSNQRLPKRQDQIKKSESVNIFGRKSEDPFEDDDFFKTSSPDRDRNANGNAGEKKKQPIDNGGGNFNWDNNFAKFDENM